MNLNWRETKELLSEFAKEVHDKNKARLNYADWKEIKGCADAEGYIIIPNSLEKATFEITLTSCLTKKYLSFSKDDGSFGQFLYEKYIVKGDDKMINNTNSCKYTGDNTTGSASWMYSPITISTSDHTTVCGNLGIAAGTASVVYEGLDKAIRDTINNENFVIDENGKIKLENEEKENKKMNIEGFDFGPCGNNVRMSMYGLAIKNTNGKWVSYDKNSGSVMDVDIFNFENHNLIYKIPSAVKNIALGDIIVHNKVPMFVIEITDSGKIVAVDIRESTEKTIIPIKNMFGFNFVVKIVSLFDGMFNNIAASADMPFGNMLPFMMMDNSEDLNPMLMLMLMNNGNMDFNNNPMLLMLLMNGDNSKDNMLPLLFMMNQNK